MLSSRHPSIWIFIDSLKKEESLNRLKVEQYIAGIQPSKKKKYKDPAI